MSTTRLRPAALEALTSGTRVLNREDGRRNDEALDQTGAIIIAEGVENEFVADVMKASGITLGQGFGLGKPTAASDLEHVATALVDRAALSGLRPRSAYLFATENR
jgi:hypothetical protein